MQYYLSIYVVDCLHAESYHEVDIVFDSLEDANGFYEQFDGKEIFDEKEFDDEFAEIRYVIKIQRYLNGNIISFIKAKYKTLDLEKYHPSFWKLYNSLSSIKY